MIMAAGLGTRLMPLTSRLPKPMVPIVGRPALGHILDLLRGHGITEVVVNLHHFPHVIREHFDDGSPYGMSVRYAYEEELLGTAGGVKNNEAFLATDTFLVLSGDSLTDVDLAALIEAHGAHGEIATLATKRVDDTSQYGVVVTDDNDRVLGFQEKPAPEEALSDLCNCGIYVFEPEIFDRIPESAFYDFGRQVFPELLEEGVAFYSHVIDAYWNDVGTIASYQEGNADALVGHVRVAGMGRGPVSGAGQSGADGVRVESGADVSPGATLVGPVFVASGCTIAEGALVRGPAVIGEHVSVASGAVVDGSILWEGCVVGPDCRVERSVLAGSVRCGEGALVRDAVVGDSCSIAPGGIVEGTSVEPDTQAT
jgi:mannose-1-phosphate guanylyltransferase/mannose-1-phosphate guanylyltransferase/phosphomannomutase